jgi:hypothetical protein
MNEMPTDEMAVTPAGYRAFRVECIDDLLHFLRYAQSTFVFRGQIDATWHLESRLRRRIASTVEGKGFGVRLFEQRIVEHFQGRASHFVAQPNLPADENDLLEWFALMQHYGGPSRLLDATRSIFIAAYFAVEGHNDNENAAIWAINLSALEVNWLVFRDASAATLEPLLIGNRPCNLPEYRSIRPVYPDLQNTFVLRAMVYGGFSQRGVCPMEPRRKNRRLIQQQALFLVPVDVGCGFQSNLVCMFQPTPVIPTAPQDVLDEINGARRLSECEQLHECAIAKLIVPRSAYEEFRLYLQQMNVSVDTLFPDLEGLTRSLDQFLPAVKERQPSVQDR